MLLTWCTFRAGECISLVLTVMCGGMYTPVLSRSSDLARNHITTGSGGVGDVGYSVDCLLSPDLISVVYV